MITAADITHLGDGTFQQATKIFYSLGDISCLMTSEK